MLNLTLSILSTTLIINFMPEATLAMVITFLMWSLSMSDSALLALSLSMQADTISWSLSLLTLWLIFLSLLASMSIKASIKFKKTYVFLNLMLALLLILSFTVSNFMMFYISFEASLIPIILITLGWGYQPERVQAGNYLLFYTVFGSLPLFFMIILMKNTANCEYMYMYDQSMTNLSFIFLILAFLVKFPMYFTHLWLLKAHVEAPLAGSMILAGLMLKLGGYGMIRVLPLCDNSNKIMFETIMVMSLWGGALTAIMCIRHMDMKLLVASSSVVHMSLCIASFLTLTNTGLKGGVLMMLSHGLSSSSLFYMSNMVYERTHSRSLFINKGLLNMMPTSALWWFLLIAVNMPAPPSINLASEIMMMISLVVWQKKMIFLLSLISFFSACYSIYLFSMSQHGNHTMTSAALNSMNVLESLVILLHWMPLNILILYPLYLI